MKWSQSSLEMLNNLDKDLRRVLDRALGYGILDLKIVETLRTRERQDALFAANRSKVRWPYSKHNVTPAKPLAEAVDVVPCISPKGVSWDPRHCLVMAGIILAAAKEEGVRVRWDGNWDEDFEPITDQDFQDLVHFELKEN
jgi:peptidoglycan L-alanyl-D-glutamate endopeptidase CwlK